jgi:hypothetical protein
VSKAVSGACAAHFASSAHFASWVQTDDRMKKRKRAK